MKLLARLHSSTVLLFDGDRRRATYCVSEPPTLATVPPDVFITHLETKHDPVSEEEKSLGTTRE